MQCFGASDNQLNFSKIGFVSSNFGIHKVFSIWAMFLNHEFGSPVIQVWIQLTSLADIFSAWIHFVQFWFCSHLVTLLSITYLHLIRYPFYNHPCNLPTFPQFIWTHEIRRLFGASEIARHRGRMKWPKYSKRFGFSDVRVVSCKVYVCGDRNCTVMISAQNAYTSPARSCSDFVSNLHIATLCDWSRKECMAGNFRIRCHEWCEWRLGWLAKGPVLPAPSRSTRLSYIGDEQLPSSRGIIS